MTVGVIFLSLGSTSQLREMTQTTVNSCIISDPDINFRILVCEGVPDIKYTGAWVTNPPPGKPFNYNEYMNICRSHSMFEGCEYVALCNNDLIFERGWATNLIAAMKETDAMSACPMEPEIHKDVVFEDGIVGGYEVVTGFRPVAGWCIFQNMRIYDIIGDIDDRAEFWHADTLYGAQLTQHKLLHILVEGSKVHHLGSQTISRLPEHLRNPLTVDSPLHKALYPNDNIS